MFTTSIIYDHRNRKTPKGAIEFRIIYNRKVFYINSGIRVRPSEFKFGQVIGRLDAAELNDILLTAYKRIQKEIAERYEDGRPLIVKELKRRVFELNMNNINKGRGFIDWAHEQVQNMQVRESTRAGYRYFLIALERYGNLTDWNDFTPENIYKFDTWLHTITTTRGGKPRPILPVTVCAHHGHLRSLLSRAEKMGLLENNPYRRLSGEFRPRESEKTDYLTEKEMAAFVSLPTEPDTVRAKAHDLFVFQMYTGLSYSDSQTFDLTNYRQEKGQWVYNGRRVKTGVPFVSHLLPPAVKVLERNGWATPKIENRVYNYHLRILGKKAGISTPLHSHIARHTFATYMLKNGVRIEHVSKMLGHTNIEQTQRYAKVLAESIHEDFEKVAKMFKQKGAKLEGKRNKKIVLSGVPIGVPK